MEKKSYIALLIWITSIIACGYYLLNFATIDTSLVRMFSTDSSQSQVQTINQLQFGPSSRLVLGSIQGTNKQDLATKSKTFIQALQATKRFSFVTNGKIPSGLGSENPLFPYRYLLSNKTTKNNFDVENLKNSFNDINKVLRAPFFLGDKATLSKDPTGEWKNYLNAFSRDEKIVRQHGVWFSENTTEALFIVLLSKNTSQQDNIEQQVNLIKKTFDESVTNSTSDTDTATLTLSGPAIFTINSRNTIRSEVQQLSLWATVAVILILLFVYRSPRLVMLSAIPVATSILVGATVVDMVFGSIHGITLAFGATLLGVVIDYPIHLFSHAHKDETMTRSVKHCWPTIRLGMFTTVAAYLAMAFANFAGLSQLGAFAMAGIIAGAFTTRWVIPAFISSSLKLNHDAFSDIFTKRLAKPRKRLTIFTLIISSLVIITAFFNSPDNLWQSDLRQFSSIPKQLIEEHRELQKNLHIPDSANIIMVSATDAETALRKTEDISHALQPLLSSDELKSFDAVSRYLPSQVTQRQRIEALPDSTSLKPAVNKAAEGMSFRKNYFDPFENAISASKTLEPLKPLAPLTQPGTLLGNKLSSMLFQQDNRWISLLPLYGIQSESNIRQIISALPTSDGTSIQYINTQNELTQMMDRYLNETIERIAWGSVIMLVVLAIGLRSWRRLLRVVLPISLGVSVTVAILLLGTGSLSIFHIVALLLTAGISIDYALFLSRNDQQPHEKYNTLTAIIVCAMSTIAVFGILGVSEIPVLQAIGKTVSIGVIVAFILALTLSQPKLLPK